MTNTSLYQEKTTIVTTSMLATSRAPERYSVCKTVPGNMTANYIGEC